MVERMVESDYLPQQPAALFAGPWLVFAPHPDDETYGMGGTLAAAVAAGIDVRVVVVTDGALGGAEQLGWTQQALVAARKRELATALAALGVRRHACWEQPDRGLVPTPALIARAREEIAALGGGTVFFPSPVEPHPDHRATAWLCWEALRAEGFSAAPVAYDISTQGPCNRLFDITPWLGHKSRAMQGYCSQEMIHPYADLVLALNRARSWSLPEAATHAESFFAFDAADCALAEALRRVRRRELDGVSLALEAAGTDAVDAPATGATAPLGREGDCRDSGDQDSGDREGGDRKGGEGEGGGGEGATALVAENARLRGELERLQQSHSWCVTAPLRWLGRVLRSGRKP